MTEKIKKNYVGYTDKVTPLNQRQFQNFTDSLLNLAIKSKQYECMTLCRAWLSFFKDKHMGIEINFDIMSNDSIKNFFANEKRTIWTEKKFKSYLKLNKLKLDKIEGVWSHENGIYQVGVIRDKKPNEFFAFIIKADGARWVPKQIKFRVIKIDHQYKTLYFSGGDHSINHPSLTKQGDILDFGIFGKWHKGTVKNKESLQLKNVDSSPKFRSIDDETCLFEMPSFGLLEYINVTDSLIKKNSDVLRKSKHLIIDLRDNSGGSVLIFRNLMPYIYTNPILTEGGMVLATEDNIRDGYSTTYPQVSDSMKRVFKQDLTNLQAHKGELYNLYPIDTIKFEKVLMNPERVSFLVNKNTASAAELFLLEAKQSTKVKLYGENSSGAVDYAEFVTSKMPCSFYSLWYPAAKSLRIPKYPLDNIGITPDVKIPNNVTDWIEFVRHYKEK